MEDSQPAKYKAIVSFVKLKKTTLENNAEGMEVL